MNWIPKWLSLGILIIILLEWGTAKLMMEEEKKSTGLKIIVPSSHVALSGDLTVYIAQSFEKSPPTTPPSVENMNYATDMKEDEIIEKSKNSSSHYFLLKVLYLLDDISELIGEIPSQSLPSKNVNISIVIPCGFFSRGGIYVLQLQYKSSTVPVTYATSSDITEVETSSELDVKWPVPSIFLDSQVFTTYPNKSIETNIRYDTVSCTPLKDVPEAVYNLQLIYCGSTVTACYPENSDQGQVLYHEEVKGYVSLKFVFLRCEYFGLPGSYVIRMKASNVNPTASNTSVYIRVEWSDEFKLTVHARSIYPCEGSGGVAVLFEYPACRLDGDRVRVYGRLRADVTSVASPSTLHYITESRSVPGKHSLTFDCDLFTEKFVEYCFVYVSQAITGAMADVKISCVPTFPFQEGDAAGWGPWSSWSPCSNSCFGGIRNRYRFCDAPPPKYGAQFCQGKAVETEFCGRINFQNLDQKDWNEVVDLKCKSNRMLAASRPEIAAEIGLQCRCGCIIVLQEQMSRRILGANTQACPGRSFWLLQAKTNFVIGLHLDQLQFPCPGQYFRARDGDSLNANLLTDIAFDRMTHARETLITSGQNLLLEFFSDELTASSDLCVGGFLAHAAVLEKKYLQRNETLTVVPFEVNSTGSEKKWMFWKPAHLVTALLLILIFFISIFLTLQFLIKYRKYRVAEDLDNLSDISELVPGRPKSLSANTLISEVVSMIEPCASSSPKEVICDVEEQYNSSETLTGYQDGSSLSSSTIKLKDTLETSSELTITSATSNTDRLLPASSVVAYNQPKVKYAYPVKLRTLDSGSSISEQLPMTGDEASDISTSNTSSLLKIYRHKEGDYSEEKEISIGSILSSPSTLRSGKETKERRNREMLLQGPGSEFSLTNPDSELELDYYDYNVANASAVPGSYLGMDPAFLVWIPPLEDSEELFLDHRNKRNSILTVETEGATLTPSEYRRIKIAGLDELKFNFDQSENRLSVEERNQERFDTGSLNREEPSGGKARTIEKIIPIRRIVDDSNVKISLESLSGVLEHKQHCIIPNRRISSRKDEESIEESNSSKSLLESSTITSDNEEHDPKEKSNSTSKKTFRDDYSNVKRNQRRLPKDQAQEHENTTNTPCKYKELVGCTQAYENKKDSVNIPMLELSGSPLTTFVQVHRFHNKNVIDSSLNIQSPDYGIETCCAKKGAFFDQDIKFVDDDDD